MEVCLLQHIPARLHKLNKPNITIFEVSEYLYRRCKPEELENPFKTISPIEISHNRGGLKGNILSNPGDVLYSIRPDEEFQKYEGMVVCELQIISLTPTNIYLKKYTETKNAITYEGVIELLHDPLCCMYPHCVFRISVNGDIVTFENYKDTLKKLNRIRNSIKEELASMVIKRQISQEEKPVDKNL